MHRQFYYISRVLFHLVLATFTNDIGFIYQSMFFFSSNVNSNTSKSKICITDLLTACFDFSCHMWLSIHPPISANVCINSTYYMQQDLYIYIQNWLTLTLCFWRGHSWGECRSLGIFPEERAQKLFNEPITAVKHTRENKPSVYKWTESHSRGNRYRKKNRSREK